MQSTSGTTGGNHPFTASHTYTPLWHVYCAPPRATLAKLADAFSSEDVPKVVGFAG